MREYISIPIGMVTEAMNHFNVDNSVIWRAAHYLTNSPRAKEIRKWLLDNGCKPLREEYILACTFEKDAKRTLQDFGHGVTLEVSLENTSAVIRVRGIEREKYNDLTLAGWGNACMMAQTIADGIANAARC